MESFFLYCSFPYPLTSPFPLSRKVFPCKYPLLFCFITLLELALILLINPMTRNTPDLARVWSAPSDGEGRWGIRVWPLAIPEGSVIGGGRGGISSLLSPRGQ